uniref:Uncharacterized protein n=1 Tax=Macrostomum lignano TaxID=282301 RepID=A0A1I8GPW6_9PLAT
MAARLYGASGGMLSALLLEALLLLGSLLTALVAPEAVAAPEGPAGGRVGFLPRPSRFRPKASILSTDERLSTRLAAGRPEGFIFCARADGLREERKKRIS